MADHVDYPKNYAGETWQGLRSWSVTAVEGLSYQ